MLICNLEDCLRRFFKYKVFFYDLLKLSIIYLFFFEFMFEFGDLTPLGFAENYVKEGIYIANLRSFDALRNRIPNNKFIVSTAILDL